MKEFDEIQTEVASLERAVHLQIERALMRVHTAIPARVLAFDSQTQTASIAPLIEQVMSDGKLVSIPPLLNVPVQFPKGGGFIFTFPLHAGDEGVAIFSERCIDAWWQSGQASPPMDYRTHDLSDALFIAGITSIPRAIGGFFMDGLSMQTLDGGTFIRVTDGVIKIQGDIEHVGNTTQQGNYAQTGNTSITGLALVGGGISSIGSAGVSVEGSVQVRGAIHAGGDVQAGAISLQQHTHGQVQSGEADTGVAK